MSLPSLSPVPGWGRSALLALYKWLSGVSTLSPNKPFSQPMLKSESLLWNAKENTHLWCTHRHPVALWPIGWLPLTAGLSQETSYEYFRRQMYIMIEPSFHIEDRDCMRGTRTGLTSGLFKSFEPQMIWLCSVNTGDATAARQAAETRKCCLFFFFTMNKIKGNKTNGGRG